MGNIHYSSSKMCKMLANFLLDRGLLLSHALLCSCLCELVRGVHPPGWYVGCLNLLAPTSGPGVSVPYLSAPRVPVLPLARACSFRGLLLLHL